jgi:hypothetical protein
MKTRIIASIAAITLLFACGKDNIINIPVVIQYANYSALDTNKYWLYEHFNLDTAGKFMSLNEFDSVYVEKDTTIRGNRYFKLIDKDYDNNGIAISRYLRDSLEFTVNSNGEILLSTIDKGVTYDSYIVLQGNDTFAVVNERMAFENKTDSVPLGKYATINYRSTYTMGSKFRQGGAIRYINNKYAEKVGLIYKTLPFNYLEKNDEVLLLKKAGVLK